jgi:mono/diheme cytochrome c family protein
VPTRSISVALRAALAAAVIVALACGGEESGSSDSSTEAGRAAYEATCAACHGEDLRGTSTGPPFIHAIYRPDHHPDDSFRAAVAHGVPSHHWPFGPMPPQPDISEEEIDAIIAYIRDRQRAAGIIDDAGG